MLNLKGENKITYIPLEQIVPCPYQPRKTMNRAAISALSENIKENGILQPLTATKISGGKYQLIAGHRRLLRADMAGFSKVPVIVLDKTEEEVAVLAVIENLQREDLNFFEQAAAIQSLMDRLNLTQAQVGEKLSLSQPAVANKLRILQLNREERRILLENNLTERHARAILRLKPDARLKAITHIAKQNLNVKQTDKYISSLLKDKSHKSQKTIIHIKDLKMFTNTIKKAVKVMQTAGIQANFTKNEDDLTITYFITVPKSV